MPPLWTQEFFLFGQAVVWPDWVNYSLVLAELRRENFLALTSFSKSLPHKGKWLLAQQLSISFLRDVSCQTALALTLITFLIAFFQLFRCRLYPSGCAWIKGLNSSQRYLIEGFLFGIIDISNSFKMDWSYSRWLAQSMTSSSCYWLAYLVLFQILSINAHNFPKL